MAIRWNERPVADELPTLPAAARPTSGAIDVWIAPRAEAIVLEHLGLATHERGGLLLGDAWRPRPADAEAGGIDPDAPVHVRILDAVPARDAAGTAVSLTMQAEVWTDARERLAPGLRIVGWFHGHPQLTAFFSATDRRTQRAFFHHPWSIGWVIDPFQAEPPWREALFVGPASVPLVRRSQPRWPDPPHESPAPAGLPRA